MEQLDSLSELEFKKLLGGKMVTYSEWVKKCVQTELKRTEEEIQTYKYFGTHAEKMKEAVRKLSGVKEALEKEIHTLQKRDEYKEEEAHNIESIIMQLKKEKAAGDAESEVLHIKKKQAQSEKEQSQKELIKTNDAFLRAINYYKLKLHIRIRFDEDRHIVVQFLDIVTPDNTACCIKLSRSDDVWQVLEFEPALTCMEILSKDLEDTQNIQGFIAQVRMFFLQQCDKKMK